MVVICPTAAIPEMARCTYGGVEKKGIYQTLQETFLGNKKEVRESQKGRVRIVLAIIKDRQAEQKFLNTSDYCQRTVCCKVITCNVLI